MRRRRVLYRSCRDPDYPQVCPTSFETELRSGTTMDLLCSLVIRVHVPADSQDAYQNTCLYASCHPARAAVYKVRVRGYRELCDVIAICPYRSD